MLGLRLLGVEMFLLREFWCNLSLLHPNTGIECWDAASHATNSAFRCSTGPLPSRYLLHDRFKNSLIRRIVHAVLQRHVQCIPLPLSAPLVPKLPSTREKIPKLVE